ncbi:MAG: DUF1684 domain-containing protein [Halodesulfurarchaeum sp.]|nr:DUF1684 domain-containing protein [Halodesulfurarchaeum sp.]
MNGHESDADDWIEAIQSHRTEKERTFTSETDTPLSKTAFARFDGLEFFPISAEYRLTGRFEAFAEPREASLDATRGPPMTFEQVGQLGVEFADELTVLSVYRAPGVESLLVPFRDQTNGEATWRHGRYLNVPAPDSTSADSENVDQSKPVVLSVDFNVAYHPLCVYDETIRSAKPPIDNELPIAIRVGERL